MECPDEANQRELVVDFGASPVIPEHAVGDPDSSGSCLETADLDDAFG